MDRTSRAGGFLARKDFQMLLDILAEAGYRCIAPVVQDGAVVFDEISRADELPEGIVEEQGPGKYRLKTSGSPRYFYWVTGPQAIKPHLFSPRESLWQVEKDNDGKLHFTEQQEQQGKIAIIGARSCDLSALALHDQHFLSGKFRDPAYEARRKGNLVVAVNCARSAPTCFCSSTGDGPEVTRGFDILLSELDEGFIVVSGSDTGTDLMKKLPLSESSDSQREKTRTELEAASRQQRSLPGRNLKDKLFSSLRHSQWDAIARRCLSCGNCTSVCPTCFCHSEHDQVAIDGSVSRHIRQWDSCFSEGHSYIHGRVLRQDTSLRFRQWMTHKLGSWHEQYGRSGCVGCGRCISWCPVGIDITAEAAVICEGGSNG